MNNQTKLAIAREAVKYMGEHKISGKALSKMSGVSDGYLNRMVAGQTEYDNGAEISTVQWNKLARAIGFDTDRTVWPKRDTAQFKAAILKLETSKRMNVNGMIIGESGCGKTYTFERFKSRHPRNTVALTLSVVHTVGSVIDELFDLVGCKTQTGRNGKPVKGSKAARLKAIATRIRTTDTSDSNMVLIFDEAENASVPVLRTIKALYDLVRDCCSILLIGTGQLERNLERMKRKDETGIPQFVSRFKANTVRLEPIERIGHNGDNLTFAEFFTDITDEGIKARLRGLCDDYRQLHDYLLPMMERSQATGEPITERMFNAMYGIIE
jgi:type II secretory pathway predicted ATPase ExeA